MRSVLISINPHWCQLIANGYKKVEVRKSAPKMDAPFKVYIYCTNKRPFLAWADVFRGNWETEFTTISGYSREQAEKIWDIFNGHIIGEFVCKRVGVYPMQTASVNELSALSLVSATELHKYAGNNTELYGWHISELEIYDSPKSLSDFVVEGDCDCLNCKKCSWFDKGNGFNVEDDCNLAYQNIQRKVPLKPLFRPPQSWCYVEELNGQSNDQK